MSLCKSGTVVKFPVTNTPKSRRCRTCSEPISLKRDRDRKNTASEKEWLLLTAETSSREDAPKEERDFLTNFE